MWTQKQLLIAILMVVTGSLNTLSTKWADTMSSPGTDGESRKFNHPYLQACSMFVGEIMCLIAFNLVYFYRKRRAGELEEVIPLTESQGTPFNRLIFLPPAMMDLLATSTMYVGLNLTFASSFQMLRGAVIVFTGLLSVAFLQRSLTFVKWFGISFILLGLAIVGLSDFSSHGSGDGHGKNNMITGDLLIVMAQIISATQMVYEEKFVSKYNVPPLQAVGWEGVFGFLVLGFLLIPMYYIPVPEPFGDNPRHVLEDAIDGFVQLYHNPLLICAFSGTIISIAFFNFAGVSVTKELSATTRMVLDSVRTLVIWMFSLAVSWQKFNYLQVIGFLFLISGMCLYNNVVIVPLLQRWGLVRRPPLNEPPRAVFAHQVVVTPPESEASVVSS
ncbi:unnamed protein product [Orchesella dallaii]|uniref:Solute carrier family 35 member F6 n=1 Tax=Orchesella dallaii TaxID=48710 RepID=A0ABP1S4M3_9HEXA